MAEAPTEDRLTEIALNLLSDAAFVFAEPAPEPLATNQSMLVARLAIEHDLRWDLVVCVELELGMVLAANLLGVENDSDEARNAAGDAVGELANILAGSVAIEFHGKNTICKIGIPSVAVEPGVVFGETLAKAARNCHFLTEEGAHLAVALVPRGRA
jgi:CheY-specific phosphatase CheX